MTRNMLFGIVRDRDTGEAFDIAVPSDSRVLARQKFAQAPNLELLLDDEADEPPSPAPPSKAAVGNAAVTPARP